MFMAPVVPTKKTIEPKVSYKILKIWRILTVQITNFQHYAHIVVWPHCENSKYLLYWLENELKLEVNVSRLNDLILKINSISGTLCIIFTFIRSTNSTAIPTKRESSGTLFSPGALLIRR